jgi:hypothetical protein
MRQNSINFDLDQTVEFKKSFELYCQISLSTSTKVALNLMHSAWQGQK